MRHRKNFNHLGRTTSHRKAMLSNMATSLILNKRISTTLAKAKALRSFVEPLITKSKEDSTHSRRIVFSYLHDKHAVSELFREISPKITDRPGGYTRILKTGTRLGDSADMCIIELVDYNENLLSTKTEKKGKSTRRRGGSKAKAETAKVVEEVKTETVASAETVATEEAPAVEDAKVEETLAVEDTKVEETPAVEDVKAEDEQKEDKKDVE